MKSLEQPLVYDKTPTVLLTAIYKIFSIYKFVCGEEASHSAPVYAVFICTFLDVDVP